MVMTNPTKSFPIDHDLSSDKSPTAEHDPSLNQSLHSIDLKVLDFLVCPLTKGPLRYHAQTHELISDQAQLAYPIRDGIPIMLIDEARTLDKEKTYDHE